jgi:hypothetical protein
MVAMKFKKTVLAESKQNMITVDEFISVKGQGSTVH